MKRKLVIATSVVLGLVVINVLLLTPLGLFEHKAEGSVRVYFADNISLGHQAAIDLFNDRHRGAIEIVPVNLPFEKFTTNERKELLARSLRSKSNRIDIFSVDHVWVPRFAKWAEPLDRHVGADIVANTLSYALESCRFDSQLVALPLYIDIGVMYYRKDIIRRLPDGADIERKLRSSMPWDEFLALRDRLGYRGKPYYVFQGKDYEGLMCNFFEILSGRDALALERDGMNIETASGRGALQFMVDLIGRYRTSPREVAVFDERLSYQYMLDNDAVFVRGWPNFVENFRLTYADTAKLRSIAQAALPRFPGKPPCSVFGGWNLMIARSSASKSEALEFARFLQTEEVQKLLFEQEGYIPINRQVYDNVEYLRDHPDLAYNRQLIDHGFHRPADEEYTRKSDILSYYINGALTGKLSVGEALSRSAQMIRSNAMLLP